MVTSVPLHQMSQSEINQEIVEIQGLTEKLSYYPDELSGGQQHRQTAVLKSSVRIDG